MQTPRLGLAGQHGPDLHLLDTGRLDIGRQGFRYLLVHSKDGFPGERVFDVFQRDSSNDTVAQRLDDFPALDDGGHIDAVERIAVHRGDDDILRHIDQPSRQIARIGGLERRIRQPFACAVRGNEVLQHRQSFTEIGRDRRFDDFARRLGHQAAHSRQLADLLFAAASAGIGHDVDRIEFESAFVLLRHLAEHFVRNFFGDVRPDIDDLVVPFAVGDGAVLVLFFHFDDALTGVIDQFAFVVRHDQVVDADGDAGLGCMQESEILQIVQHQDRRLETEIEVAVS